MARKTPLLRTILALSAALLAAVLLALALGRIDRVVIARGELRGGSRAVHAPFTAAVAEVLVAAGRTVAAGAPLARLRTDELEAERAVLARGADALAARVEWLVARTERTQAGLHQAETSGAARDTERARIELAGAETRVALLEELVDDGLVRGVDLADAELARALAAVALDRAQDGERLLAAEHDDERLALDAELVQARAALEERRGRLGEIDRLVALATITAPIAGVVTEQEGMRLDELAGASVEEGRALLRIAHGPPETFEARAADRARVLAQPGMRARIRLEGYPWLLHGVVPARLATLGARASDERGFVVRLDLEAESELGPLYEGMRGEARIVVEEDVSILRILVDRVAGPGRR